MDSSYSGTRLNSPHSPCESRRGCHQGCLLRRRWSLHSLESRCKAYGGRDAPSRVPAAAARLTPLEPQGKVCARRLSVSSRPVSGYRPFFTRSWRTVATEAIVARQHRRGARPETFLRVLAEAIRHRKNVDDLVPHLRIPLLRLCVAGHLQIHRYVFFAPLPPDFRL